MLNLNPVYLVIKSTTPTPEGISMIPALKGVGMFHFIKRGNKKIIYLAKALSSPNEVTCNHGQGNTNKVIKIKKQTHEVWNFEFEIWDLFVIYYLNFVI